MNLKSDALNDMIIYLKKTIPRQRYIKLTHAKLG